MMNNIELPKISTQLFIVATVKLFIGAGSFAAKVLQTFSLKISVLSR